MISQHYIRNRFFAPKVQKMIKMKIRRIIILLAVAVVICSMAVATAHAVNLIPAKNEKTNNGFIIESQSKTATYKITWNANNGKIGTKKSVTTTVKKGSKISNLLTSPKRSGYTFEGWYTKKSGGRKITKNTKLTKTTTFYAHWNKKGSSNSKLVDVWRDKFTYSYYGGRLTGYRYYSFSKDGTFKFFQLKEGYNGGFNGKYKLSGGKIYFTNMIGYDYSTSTKKAYNHKKYSNKVVMEYKIGKDRDGDECLNIPDMVDIPHTQDISFRLALSSTYFRGYASSLANWKV